MIDVDDATIEQSSETENCLQPHTIALGTVLDQGFMLPFRNDSPSQLLD